MEIESSRSATQGVLRVKHYWNYALLWFRNQWISLSMIGLKPLPPNDQLKNEMYLLFEYGPWLSPCSWNWRDPQGIWFIGPMIMEQ